MTDKPDPRLLTPEEIHNGAISIRGELATGNPYRLSYWKAGARWGAKAQLDKVDQEVCPEYEGKG